jgi:hypothetical protein
MEFIRPIVEERSAKMKEFGENWDDAPVRQLICFEFVFIYLRYSYDGSTE